MPLSAKDRDRLASLLGLFSSHFDGEILNAARLAEKLVKNAGETWESVITGRTPDGGGKDDWWGGEEQERPKRGGTGYHAHANRARPESDRKSTDYGAHRAETLEMLSRRHLLTTFEIEFLESVEGRDFLTERQRPVFERIRRKMAGFAGMSW